MLDKKSGFPYNQFKYRANAKKRSSTCALDFRERVEGVNPYEESMEGVLEQRSELENIVVSDGDSTVKRNVV